MSSNIADQHVKFRFVSRMCVLLTPAAVCGMFFIASKAFLTFWHTDSACDL